MQTKLTLRLDEDLIEDAKIYAARHGRSLSQLVADYFAALAGRKPNDTEPADVRPSPLTDSLVGLLRRDDTCGPDAYLDHLRTKHLHREVQ